VDQLSRVARQAAVTSHGIAMHAHQALGLADAAALGDVVQDRGDCLLERWARNRGVPFRSEKRAVQERQ
jgi:hypothetical protein